MQASPQRESVALTISLPSFCKGWGCLQNEDPSTLLSPLLYFWTSQVDAIMNHYEIGHPTRLFWPWSIVPSSSLWTVLCLCQAITLCIVAWLCSLNPSGETLNPGIVLGTSKDRPFEATLLMPILSETEQLDTNAAHPQSEHDLVEKWYPQGATCGAWWGLGEIQPQGWWLWRVLQYLVARLEKLRAYKTHRTKKCKCIWKLICLSAKAQSL